MKDTVQNENNENYNNKIVCLLKEVLTSNNENHPSRFLKEVCLMFNWSMISHGFRQML